MGGSGYFGSILAEDLVKQGVNKFMKAPVKNSIGKKWIKRAKLLKKQGIK